MDFQHQVNYSDTTYIDLTTNQIKSLHDEIFGSTLINEDAMKILVKLEIAYIPFLLLIIVLVLAINYRWNKTFDRIKEVYETMPDDVNHDVKFGMLKMQRRNLFDRLFVYLIIWGVSLYIDTMLMSFGIFDFPYLSIPVVVLVVSKKLSILINTNTLKGYNDTDIKQKFDNIIDKMILNPIIDGVSSRITKYFREDRKNNKNKEK